jgi:transcriptional regulator with XRE-family HTH domain
VAVAKSIHSPEYAVMLVLLRKVREEAGLRQVDLAARLGRLQTFVSKVETGERRLDVLELRSICRELGTDLPTFVGQLEAELTKLQPERSPHPRRV